LYNILGYCVNVYVCVLERGRSKLSTVFGRFSVGFW